MTFELQVLYFFDFRYRRRRDESRSHQRNHRSVKERYADGRGTFSHLIASYEALGAMDRAEVVGYDEFLRDYYLTRDEVPVDAEDRFTYFDSEYGLQQIEVRGSSATLAYERAIAYGDESGSIKVSGKSGTGSSWRIYLGLKERKM